jgi:hypothetical protein
VGFRGVEWDVGVALIFELLVEDGGEVFFDV